MQQVADKMNFQDPVQKYAAGLRNPREHGSGAPRKKITDGRKSKKNTWKQQQQLRNKNRGLRMLILFLNMA